MIRPTRLLAPLFGAATTLLVAGIAQGAQGARSEDDAAAGDSFDPEAPVATSQAGTRVASSQVEGSASVSTESGLSASASSEGLQGRFGLGAIRTLSGLTGVNARYFILDKLALGLSVGVGTWTFRENDPDTMDVCPGADCELEDTRTIATLGMGLEALYFVQLGRPAGQLPFYADFGVGGRFVYFQGINAFDDDTLDDPTEFDIEIPAVVQLRFGEHFVLAPEFGFNFIIVPGSRAESDLNPGTGKPDTVIAPNDSTGPFSGPGFGFRITDGVGLFGGASLHYYF